MTRQQQLQEIANDLIAAANTLRAEERKWLPLKMGLCEIMAVKQVFITMSEVAGTLEMMTEKLHNFNFMEGKKMDKDTEAKQAANGSPAPPLEKVSEPGNNGYSPEQVFLQKAAVLLDAAMQKVPGEAKKALVDAIVAGVNEGLGVAEKIEDRISPRETLETIIVVGQCVHRIITTLATHGRILSRLGPTLDLIEQKFNTLEQSSETLVGIQQEHRAVVERLESIDQKFTGIGRSIEVLTRIIQKPAADEGVG